MKKMQWSNSTNYSFVRGGGVGVGEKGGFYFFKKKMFLFFFGSFSVFCFGFSVLGVLARVFSCKFLFYFV